MAKILLIETSAALCSVALEIDGRLASQRRSDDYQGTVHERAHAKLTAVFCDEVLREAGMKAGDLDAVCISEGPGSYTGLRVGLSTAKGLCFGAGIKMLSVCTLDILAAIAGKLERPEGFIWKHTVPMVDARRMEVYTAVYAADGTRTSEVEAKVIEQGSFADIASTSIFIGDGASKCREAIGDGVFSPLAADAAAMVTLAEKEYAAENFRDVAYFEPFYLKEFVATSSKKKLF